MRHPISSFISHDGKWWVAPYEPKPTTQLLRKTLDNLLKRHPTSHILILRIMTQAEVELLHQYRGDVEAEILSRILAPGESKKSR